MKLINEYTINMKVAFIAAEQIMWSRLVLLFFLCSVFNFVDVGLAWPVDRQVGYYGASVTGIPDTSAMDSYRVAAINGG